MKLPEIIGIAGTNGSGKDTLADLRLEKQNARKVSLSDILRVEATKRGLDHERENLRTISVEWGRRFGAGALSLMTLKEYWETKTDTETGISIVSVRRPGEAEVIQDNDGFILWVDADREERYRRIKAAKRGRIDDLVDFDEFCAQEEVEMYPSTDDPTVVNMAGVREIADIHLWNSFSSEDHYKSYLVDAFEIGS